MVATADSGYAESVWSDYDDDDGFDVDVEVILVCLQALYHKAL